MGEQELNVARRGKGACPRTGHGEKSARLARVTTPLPENNRSHIHLLTRDPNSSSAWAIKSEGREVICANGLALAPCAAGHHVPKAPFLVPASVGFPKTMDAEPRGLLHLYYSNLGAHLRRVTGSRSLSRCCLSHYLA